LWSSVVLSKALHLPHVTCIIKNCFFIFFSSLCTCLCQKEDMLLFWAHMHDAVVSASLRLNSTYDGLVH